VVTPAKNSMPK